MAFWAIPILIYHNNNPSPILAGTATQRRMPLNIGEPEAPGSQMAQIRDDRTAGKPARAGGSTRMRAACPV